MIVEPVSRSVPARFVHGAPPGDLVIVEGNFFPPETQKLGGSLDQ